MRKVEPYYGKYKGILATDNMVQLKRYYGSAPGSDVPPLDIEILRCLCIPFTPLEPIPVTGSTFLEKTIYKVSRNAIFLYKNKAECSLLRFLAEVT